MDVQCERCKTEYEFDDALVSGRGTTVRCTNCGHQFKVRRPDAAPAGGDQWLVRTRRGQQLTFLTLRELQRAILAKQVARLDVLTRGQAPPRTLGSIAELEPFFDGRTSSRPPPAEKPVPIVRVPTPGAPSIEPSPLPKRTAAWGPAPVPPPARPRIDTLRPDEGGAAPPPPPPPRPASMQRATPPPPPAAPPVEALPVVSATPYAFGQGAMAPPGTDDPVTLRRPITPPPPPVAPAPTSPLPPPTTPVRRPMPTGDDELPPMRGWQGSHVDSHEDSAYSVRGRRRVGGWVVAAVLLLAVGVVGWVVAKPYLAGRAAAPVAQLDPRTLSFVTEGEKALGDGNLDLAQEDFDKASALAEKDPRVLVDEARVAAARSDVPWLKLHLLPPDAADETRATKAQLADRTSRVRKAADDAVAAAPEDPTALRAKVDALRIIGERDAARSLVSKIIGQASQPETAYVLAALDLSEPEPLWTTVVDRLRLAAAGEGNAGRARAALVYALAKSGDVAGAKSELAKLDAMSRPYPLLTNLHAFVDKAPAKAAVDGGVASVPHVDVSALPAQPPPPAGGAGGAGAGAAAGGGGGGGEAPVPGDARGAMAAAGQAIRKGDWAHARQIYEGVVSRNPSDSEALSGLGDCARATGDSSGAISAYKRALAVNPSYLPALLGVADTQWASGDRGSAQQAYKNIEDRFPEGTYPPYVKSRAEGGGSPAPAAAPSTAPAGTAAPAPKPATSEQDGL
jgi:predicted Zn finger-like uncharacterized protein